ncbi:hypothetical protein JHK85_017900 [Glycine max]|nr:hypothetical protein JHK85_017900 [Glycine max]
MLDKSIREIERERLGLQNQKKLIVEIKKNAKQAQMTLKSTQAMGEATKGITKAMGQMNRWTADEFAFCTEDDARV